MPLWSVVWFMCLSLRISFALWTQKLAWGSNLTSLKSQTNILLPTCLALSKSLNCLLLDNADKKLNHCILWKPPISCVIFWFFPFFFFSYLTLNTLNKVSSFLFFVSSSMIFLLCLLPFLKTSKRVGCYF